MRYDGRMVGAPNVVLFLSVVRRKDLSLPLVCLFTCIIKFIIIHVTPFQLSRNVSTSG